MIKRETHGYRRYAEMRQFCGFDKEGRKMYKEGYIDMTNNSFHSPDTGWSGAPPELPPGERVQALINDTPYRKGYALIKWDRSKDDWRKDL